jgi:VWFA-related protein
MRLLFIVLLGLLAPLVRAQDSTPTFHAGVSDVRVDVQAVAGSAPIEGLKRNDFAVFDSGMVQPITYFGHESEPVSLVLLLDVSGSMQKSLEEIARRANEALSLLSPGDRVAVMVFGRTTALHQDFSDNLAETARQLQAAIHGHDVGAGTAINSAVLDAARLLHSHPSRLSGRNAILIVTDNLCINYKHPDAEVVRALDEDNIVLDAIVTGRGIRPAPPRLGEYRNPDFTPADVFHLAEETGGDAIHSNQAGAALRDMLEAIRARYSLSYRLPPAAPGAWRSIEVELTPMARQRYPNAVLRYRAGYYTPGS